MTEKKRANPDYSASAVNLTNPVNALQCLAKLHSFRTALDETLTDIENSVPAELKKRRDGLEMDILDIMANIKVVIDNQGSYQDTEKGLYALKQRKVSKSYNAENFEDAFPQYAPAVIKKAVDTTKLAGLIKGGLVSEDDLRKNIVLEETESFAYIIK